LSSVVFPGIVYGLIGPNAAGKTTLLNVISGFHFCDEGQIFFKDEKINSLHPHERARIGIGRTFQVPKLFRKMTVVENLLVPGLASSNKRKNSLMELEDKALEILELVKLVNLKDELAEKLSGGQQKLLDFVRVLMMDPYLFLLDEVTAGVNVSLIETMMAVISEKRKERKSFVVVSHDLSWVMEVCDKVAFMSHGEKIVEGKPEEIKECKEVVDAYFGCKKYVN
jgi:branched-chain amino acid transport system ATP-binding protein